MTFYFYLFINIYGEKKSKNYTRIILNGLKERLKIIMIFSRLKMNGYEKPHELIRQHKLPQPYLDDDYLDIDDLFEADFTPTEALQELINCGKV